MLIFGVEGWIPPLGLIGGAISNLVAQGGLCLVLFCIFLSPAHAQIYGTHQWRFNSTLFWDCIRPGLLRALNRISVVLCWACIARLMIEKQGDYLLIWSLGSTIGLFLPFIGEAICQALTTIASNLVGAKNFQFLGRMELSGFFVISTIIVMLGIPMLVFPEALCRILFPDISLSDGVLKNVFFGLWLSFSFGTLAYIPVSRLLAFKDINFFLVTGGLSWIKNYMLMYCAIVVLEMPPEQCWTFLSLSNLADLALYLWRANWLAIQKNIAGIAGFQYN